MKKFLVNIVLFGLFSFLFYVVIMPLWSSSLPFFMSKNVRSCMGCYGHTFTRMKEAKEMKNIDVLIVGSSHAYRGIDPRILKKQGINAFNLGSSAQTPINTKMLLHQYLDSIKPKIVVYEVYAGTLVIDGLESSLDLLSNNRIDKNSFTMASKQNKLVTYNTFLFSSFRQIFGLNKTFSESLIQGDDTYIKGTGYVQTRPRIYKIKEESQKEWLINDNQLKALKENVNYINSKGIKLMLIQTPITNSLYNSKNNNKQIDSIMNSLGNYKSYQKSLIINDSLDFYDNNHMNHNLVERFSKNLSIDIKNILNGNSKK